MDGQDPRLVETDGNYQKGTQGWTGVTSIMAGNVLCLVWETKRGTEICNVFQRPKAEVQETPGLVPTGTLTSCVNSVKSRNKKV